MCPELQALLMQLDRESAIASRDAREMLRRLHAGTGPKLRTIVKGNHIQYFWEDEPRTPEPGRKAKG